MNFVSGYQLGASPSEIEINHSGECALIYVFSNDYSGNIGVSDKWNRERGTNIKDYTLNAEDIGLDVRYFNSFELNGIGKEKVCIYGSGKYYGLMLFRAVEGNVEVGTRVIFNGGGGIGGIGSSLISGKVISDNITIFEGFGAKEVVLMSSFAVSLTLVWFLFFILRQERAKSST